MEADGAAKKHIWLHQLPERGDRLVLNADDPEVRTWTGRAPSGQRQPAPGVHIAWFSTRPDQDRLVACDNIAQWTGDTLMWNRGAV